MSSKHTPGPWFFDPERHPHHYGCNVGAETGENIATVHPGESGDAETISNARLIKAAPKLLEALEAIIRESDNLPENQFQQAAAAIAEAKGDA